ncbi:MAG: TonB-dependent receptor [Ignavibacteriales bacterium]|nr:TonB-dependent receptor [Ignavibacteriales bacterium]
MIKKYLIGLLFILFLQNSFAQTLKDSVKYTLEPITITATRLTEPWIEIPLAVTPVAGLELNKKKGYGLDEVLSIVPGVLTQSRYGNQDVRIAIRGFGARGAGERSNAGTSRGIRVILDGFPETEPDGRTSFDLIDLSSIERIEVIRSNASTLWGNAAGGILNLTSNTSFENPFAHVQSSFGSFGYRKESMNLGTFIGNGRFFLSISNINSDGWREHSGSTRSFVNTGIVSLLGERTTLGIFLTGSSNLFRIPGPLTQQQFDNNPKQAQGDTLNYKPTYLQRDERRFNRLGRLGARLSHDLDDNNGITFSIHVSPKYLQRSERNTFRDFNRYHVGGNITYQNRWVMDDKMKNIFLLGTDEAYQDGSILFYSLVDGTRGSSLKTNKREGANSFGIFGQDELMLNNFSLVLGARFDDVTYYNEDYLNPKLSATKSFSRITPKAGITYRFSQMHSIYANLGGGIEIPAGNETDPPSTFGQDTITSLNPLLEPSRSTTIEVGTKHIIAFENNFLSTITYDAAFYYIDVKNDIIPYSGGRFYFTAGKSRRMGTEIGLTVQSTHGISLQCAFTVTDNIYSEYIIDSTYYNKPGKYRNLKDNKIAGIPGMMYKSTLRYSPTFFANLFTEISIQGLSKYYADDGNILSVPAYNNLNAVIGINSIEIIAEKLSVNGFFGVNNILDKSYAASAFINPDYDQAKLNPIFLEPGLPRNFIGSFDLRWNF